MNTPSCSDAAVPEFIDLVFAKTSRKRSFSMTEHERFGFVFANTGSIHSGTGGGKGYTITSELWTLDSGNENTLTSTLLAVEKYIALWVNAGMSECRKKVMPASAFSQELSRVSPASVFRHQVQSGTGLVCSRISPALPSYALNPCSVYVYFLNLEDDNLFLK